MTFIYNTPLLNINIPKVPFRANPNVYSPAFTPPDDRFSTNPFLDGLENKAVLTQMAKSNPKIMKILKENDIPLNIDTSELDKLKHGHLADTRVTVAKMYSALDKDLKENINQSDLQQAAMLHDVGKAFIPDKILNKKGKLLPEERKIMDLHSELGYQLLKQKGVSDDVLRLVRYHHQDSSGGGYPKADKDFVYDIPAQMLKAADKYSALTEKRSYKDALSKDEALEVMRNDVDSGLIAPEVYNALEKSV